MNNSRSEQQRSGAANPPWLAKLRKARFRHLLFSLSLLIFLSPVVGIFSSELGRTIASLLVIWLVAAVLVIWCVFALAMCLWTFRWQRRGED